MIEEKLEIRHGRIPEQFKTAKIPPLYKSKETNLLANFLFYLNSNFHFQSL